MNHSKNLLILALCLPLCLAANFRAAAANYPALITVVAGASNAGLASSVRVTVYDNSHNTLVASSNTPDGTHAFAESAVTPGTYYALYAIDTTKLPIYIEPGALNGTVFTISSIGSDRAAEQADGYTAALTGTLTTGATNSGTLLLSLATYQSALVAGSTSSVLSTALTGTADLTGAKVVFTTGINKGVTRTISSMNSGTGAITLLTATPSTPGATDAFSIVQGSKALEQFLAALGTDNRPVLSANAQPATTDTSGVTALLSRLGTPAGATLAADVAAVKADTGGLTTSVAALPASTVAALFGSSFITIPGSHTTTGTGEVLTYKQMQSLSDAVLGGDNTSTVPAASGTATVTYYLRGQPKVAGNVVAVSTVTYDASKNQVGRVVLVSQPYPAIP